MDNNLYKELSDLMITASNNGSIYNRPDGRLTLFSFALKALHTGYDIEHTIEVTRENLNVWNTIKLHYRNDSAVETPCPSECFITVQILKEVLDFLVKAKEMVDYIKETSEMEEAV